MRPGRDLIADLSSDRDRPCPSHRFGKPAEPLAEIIGRGEHAEGLGHSGTNCAGAAPLDDEAEQHRRFMRRVFEQLVLQRGFEVAETRNGGVAGLADLRPAMPIEMPKSSVMRFEISPEISSSFAGGTSLVFDQATVGSDISSATQGSSVVSVAGKKPAPTKQCAKALGENSKLKNNASASAHEHLTRQNMSFSIGGVNGRPAVVGR